MQWLTFTSGRASQDRIFCDDVLARRSSASGSSRAQPSRSSTGCSAILRRSSRNGSRIRIWTRTGTRTTRPPSSTQDAACRSSRSPAATTVISPARCALSRAPENAHARGARATLSRHRPVGSCRHAHAAGGVRRTEVRPGQPGRSAEAASRLVRMDDAGRSEAGVPAEGGGVLRHGRGKWRYADTLDAVTARIARLLSRLARQSRRRVRLPVRSATKRAERRAGSVCLRSARCQRRRESNTRRSVIARRSADGPCRAASSSSITPRRSSADTEISGFFKLSAWLAIDQPDTDFRSTCTKSAPTGTSILLSSDLMRARYRESAREPKLDRDARAAALRLRALHVRRRGR